MSYSVAEFVSNIELKEFKVKNILLDVENSKFQINVEGSYFIKKPHLKTLMKDGEICIDSYWAFEARYLDPKTKLWYTMDYENLGMIEKICEKSYEDESLTLGGYGKSGLWIEYVIYRGDILISFLD